ncbi:hypothetical protein Trydic_g6868 [Trypoxylus dichotomus]
MIRIRSSSFGRLRKTARMELKSLRTSGDALDARRHRALFIDPERTRKRGVKEGVWGIGNELMVRRRDEGAAKSFSGERERKNKNKR